AEAVRSGRQRLRTSILVQHGGKTLLVDSTPDMRQQLLAAGGPAIDAVIWTHGHYDHYAGYGDFYRVQDPPPVYADPRTLGYAAEYFTFLSFVRHPAEPYHPFDLFGITITFIETNHPPAYSCGLLLEHEGFRVGYTSDTLASIPERSGELLRGVDLLFVDGIAPPEIRLHKHMNYAEACRFAGEVGAKDFRCVHLSHLIPWEMPHQGRDMESFGF
ncbi:MAG: MBL fold metallo-hydrolase, partial [Methanomicrobiales archaeon]|nr:MBL fold metallo-hydrolase [Methanomicrobiales archaeon]